MAALTMSPLSSVSRTVTCTSSPLRPECIFRAPCGIDRQRTVRLTVVVAAGKPGLVPVIVNVRVPRCALFAASIVNVELVPLTDTGLKVAVTPGPMPVTDRVTTPVKSPVRVTVIA